MNCNAQICLKAKSIHIDYEQLKSAVQFLNKFNTSSFIATSQHLPLF
jgi:hypothetical protein